MRCVAVLLCALLSACQPAEPDFTDEEPDPLSVFVVGDSWAELSQGSISAFSTDSMPATRLEELGYAVDATYAFGYGGTAAVWWAAGDPCDTPGDSCGDAQVYERLIDSLQSADSTPFIYLSLGGNDLRVGGSLVDLGAPVNRDEVFGNLELGLSLVVDDILDTRPDAQMVIAGYANFTSAGVGLEEETCGEALDSFLPLTPAVDEQLINSMFSEGSYDSVAIGGLYDVYRSLAAEHEQVHFEGYPHLFADDPTEPWSPSREGTMVDCLHLTPENQRAFVSAVVDGWEG